jgi:hypothetical protein
MAVCLGATLSGQEQADRTAVIGPTVGDQDRVAPATVLVRDDAATMMRLGATKGELLGSEWQPYQRAVPWYLRGQQLLPLKDGTWDMLHQVTVYVETDSAGVMTAYEGERVPGLARFPIIGTIGDSRASDVRIAFDCTWPQHWTSYWDVPYFGNVFWPVSVSHTDGSGGRDTSYCWVDDSRFLVDAPESPNSVLWAVLYWRDVIRSDRVQRSGGLNVRNHYFNVDLRIKALDLRGGSIHAWIENADGRWHQTLQPLQAGITWTSNRVLMTDTENEWVNTYDRNGTNPAVSLDNVTSFGMSFLYFPRDDAPTGRIEFDNVSFEAYVP